MKEKVYGDETFAIQMVVEEYIGKGIKLYVAFMGLEST